MFFCQECVRHRHHAAEESPLGSLGRKLTERVGPTQMSAEKILNGGKLASA